MMKKKKMINHLILIKNGIKQIYKMIITILMY